MVEKYNIIAYWEQAISDGGTVSQGTLYGNLVELTDENGNTQEENIITYFEENSEYLEKHEEIILAIPYSITIDSEEKNITSIGESAFEDCSSLTSVTIPDSVTSIEGYAFNGCSSLTSITIPDGVTLIGEYVFGGCSELANITIPDSVTLIGGRAFYGCSSLTSIIIPDSVTSIGEYVFNDCSNLTSITIPDSVISIGNSAFSYCSSLTSITIPNSITYIGNSAFYKCSSLTSITIPDTVTLIGGRAFYGCSSLTSIIIPDSVTSIGEYVFNNCRSLTNITIPDSVISIEGGAFSGCSSLTNITIPDSVISIGISAFSGCSNLTSITIPDGVTLIGEYVFNDCSNLTSITIPDGVTLIGKFAFYDCSNLTSITIPDSVTSIGIGAFYDCSSLTSVTIPDGVTLIGEYAFNGCSSLTSITLPESVTSIGISAFNGCKKIQEVKILGTLNTLSANLFNNNISLKRILLPKSIKKIEEGAFASCDALSLLYYLGTEEEWNLVSIGTNNNKIESVEKMFSAEEGSCGQNINWFLNKESQTLVFEGEGYIDDYDDMWRPWDGVKDLFTEVQIGSNITGIGNYNFYECDRLITINLPKNVIRIGKDCFVKSGIEQLQSNWINGMLIVDNCLLSVTENYSNSIVNLQTQDIRLISENCLDETINNNLSIISEIILPRSLQYLNTNAICFKNNSDNNRKVKITINSNKTFLSDNAIGTPEVIELYLYTNSSAVKYASENGINIVFLNNKFDIKFNGNQLKTIGAESFKNRNEITSLSIPSNIEGSIGKNAFNGCANLLSIKLPIKNKFNFVDLFGSVPKNLKNVEVNSVYNNIVPKRAFYNESKLSLENIVLPDTVTSIGTEAFYNAGLIKFTMPSCVESIGENAFNMKQEKDENNNWLSPILWWNTPLDDNAELGLKTLKDYFGEGNIQSCYGNKTVVKNKIEVPSVLTKLFVDSNILQNSGDCGKEGSPVNWRINGEILEIVGNNNPMKDYSLDEEKNKSPWSGFDATIKTIKIKNVSYIGNYAFANLKGDFTVEFDYFSAVTVEIGANAFSNSNLSKINLPSCVKKIKTQAFSNCKNLTEIIISDDIEIIEKEILYGSYNVKNISLPSLYTEGSEFDNIGYLWYYGTTANEVYENATNYYITKESEFYYSVPNYMNEIKITSGYIPEKFFYVSNSTYTSEVNWDSFVLTSNVVWSNHIFNQETLKKLELPVYENKRVVSAFEAEEYLSTGYYDVKHLNYIKINNETPPSRNIIGFSFKYLNGNTIDLSECTSLKILNDTYLFSSGDRLNIEHLILPSTVTEVTKSSLFSREINLKTIKGGSFNKIGASVFQGLSSLVQIDMGTLISIGKYAFYNCKNLQGTINLKTSTIPERAFYDCTSLTRVKNEYYSSLVGTEAFYNCESLKEFDGLYISDVNKYAFYNCKNLQTIKGLSSNTRYNGAYNFFGCESLILPTGFTFNTPIISPYCFFNCKKLFKNSNILRIGTLVTTIEEAAFGNCNISSNVVVPNNVTTIGMGAFYNYQGEDITIPFIGSNFDIYLENLGNYDIYIGSMFWSIFGIATIEELSRYSDSKTIYYGFSAPSNYVDIYDPDSQYRNRDQAFYNQEKIKDNSTRCEILLSSQDYWVAGDERFPEERVRICFPSNLKKVYINNDNEIILSALAFYDKNGSSKLEHTYFKNVEKVKVGSSKQIGAYNADLRYEDPSSLIYSSHPYFTCKAQSPEQWELPIGAIYSSNSYSLYSNGLTELSSLNNEEKVLMLDYNKKYSWDLLTYGNKYDVYITDNNTYVDGYSYLPQIYASNHSGVEVGQQIILQGEHSYKIDKIDRFKTTGKIYHRQSKGILSGQLSYYGVTKGTLFKDTDGNYYLSKESDVQLWELLGNSKGIPINFSTSSIYDASLCKATICREDDSEDYKVTIKPKSGEDISNLFEKGKFSTIALQYVVLTKATLPLELMHNVKKDTKFTVALDSMGNGVQTVSTKTEDYEIIFEPGFKITTTGYAQTMMTLADEQLILPNNLDTKEVLVVIDAKGKITFNGNSGELVNQGTIDANLNSIIKPNETTFSIKDYNDENNDPITFTITDLDEKTNLITFDKQYRIYSPDSVVQEIQLDNFLDISTIEVKDLSLTLNYINFYHVKEIKKYEENVIKENGEQLYLIACEEVVTPTNFEVVERSLEKEAILERNSMILNVTTMDGETPPSLLVEANAYYSIYSNYIKSPSYYFETMIEGTLKLWQDGNKLQSEQDEYQNDLSIYRLKDLTSSTSMFEATYDGNVSFYSWSLQEKYEDEYIEIDKTTNKYSVNMFYNYNFFENDTDYRLIFTITTTEGLIVNKYIYFHVSYDNFLGIRDVTITKDCINQAIKLDFTRAKMLIGVEYAYCPQSWLDDPNLHYEFLYLLITRQIKGQPESTTTIAHLYDIVDSFYDYSFNREEEYIYSIVPVFKDKNKDLLEKNVIIKGAPCEIEPAIQFNLKTIALIGTQTTFDDLLKETQSIKNSYLADNSEFNCWYFKYNTEAKNINITTDKAIFETISPYATIGNSNRNYKTGTVTALLGAFHKNEKLDEWTYKDSIRLQNKFQSFANNGKVKMLRDEMGNVLPVDITLKSFEYTPHTVPTTIRISFEWSQVGEEEDFAVYSVKPFEAAGTVTFNGNINVEVKQGIVSENLINRIVPNQTYFNLNNQDYIIKTINDVSGIITFEDINQQGYYKQLQGEEEYHIQLFDYKKYDYTIKGNLKYS